MATVLVATPVLSYGQTVTAMWDPNPASQLVLTYDVCIGTTSLSCNFTNASVPAANTSYAFLPNPGVLYRVAIRAVNAAGAGAYSPEVLVSVPALGTLVNRTNTVNAAISPVTIPAIDPDGSPLTFTHTGLPFGLTLNQSTGVITGAPTTTGTYNVTIFVTDGLATASAAFVWTIQAPSTDTMPPTLSITSHTNGQTVTTSSITLSGTATDSGTGNNGIQSVTVNGAAATGGTASGSNTANWSRSVSLATGANTLTVVATDGVGNARTSSITINRSSTDTAPPTLTITSHTNGQTVTTASITLSGTATDSGTGGSGITSVTVNGVAATGGTATGSNTANWSRSLSLVTGANTLTVVARDGAGNTRTSSITVTRISTEGPVLSAVSVTPASGSGTSQTFSAVFSDSVGATDLASALIKLDIASAGATNSCMVQYDRAANKLSLRDNAGNWLAGAAPGSAVTQQNSQCALLVGSSSVSVSGQNLTMNVAMSFTATYAGAKNVYLKASNVAGSATTAWQQRGTWTIPSTQGTLTAGTVTPNTGSSASQLFSAQYADSLGTSDLASVELKFSTDPTTAIGVCMVQYTPAAGTLSLRDDVGVYQTPQTFASGVVQENSQCRVNFAGSSAILSGQTLTLNVAITFKPAFAGLKNIYSRAKNITGATTGLQLRGTWTVPSTALSADSVTPNAGTGSTGTFAAQFTDSYGVSDIAYVYIKFATMLSGGVNVCMVRYEPATGLMSLRDDSGAYFTGQPFAQGGTQQNSQCSIAFSTSGAAVSGSTLTWSVNVTFKAAYAGAKNIYLNGSTLNGSMTTWQQRGTWTVPSTLGPSGG